MQNDTKKKKRLAPILCAAIFIVLLLIYLIAFLFPLLGAEVGDGVAIAVLLIGVISLLAIIGGIILALHQRLKEIEGGEEEDAQQY